MTGIELIVAERAKQTAKWSLEHDKNHSHEIEQHAVAVLTQNEKLDEWGLLKNHSDRIQQLAVAGALIAAEIDRLQNGANPKTNLKWVVDPYFQIQI